MHVYVYKAEFIQIGFFDAGAGCGGNNEHTIHKNSTDFGGWGDAAQISDPVWIADGDDAGSDPDKNEPVCYVRSKSGVDSKIKVTVVVKVQPAGVAFSLVGKEGSTEYFRKDGLSSTGGNHAVSIVASEKLPSTVQKLSKSYTWKVVLTYPDPDKTCNLGVSTHTVYVIYDNPVLTVENQTNKLTPKRLDFCIVGVAAGESNKVTICDKIVQKVRNMTGDTYGQLTENPRWKFYNRPPDRDLDCHHRAALAASAFGVVGITGHVHKIYATCHPVPAAPPGYSTNSTKNDYVSTYGGNKKKYRKPSADIHQLVFQGNNFEGCVRVEDDSADDDNAWWTVWPRKQHATAKQLIIWYNGSCPERWAKLDWTFVENETVPVAQLADKPKIIGGPN